MKTRKAFYRALKSIASQFTWNLNQYNELRATDEVGSEYCPITALYHARTENYYSPGNYDRAAARLGLSIFEADKIVGGADGNPSPLSKTIRKALVRAVNPTYEQAK